MLVEKRIEEWEMVLEGGTYGDMKTRELETIRETGACRGRNEEPVEKVARAHTYGGEREREREK